MKYRHSRFSKSILLDGKYILFHSWKLSVCEISREDYAVFEAYRNPNDLQDNEITEALLNYQFIVPEDFDETTEAVEHKRTERDHTKSLEVNRLGYMRISLTEDCNLRCKYCFVNDIMEHKGFMSEETFTHTMEWFIKTNEGQAPAVQYFGGEPLLCMNLIKKGNEMLRTAMEAGRIQGFSEEIVTNGTLVTPKTAKTLVDNGVTVLFSIDGWDVIHDQNRVYPNGKGSYHTLLKGIRNFKEAGGRLEAIITPTEENLPIFFDIMRHLVEDLHFEEITVNTPQPTAKGWDIDGRKFAQAIIDSWNYCVSKKVRLNQPGNNIVYFVTNKIPQTHSCMNLSYGQGINTFGIYVTSDQTISSCIVECDDRCSRNIEDFKIDQEYIDWHFMDNNTKSCIDCIGYNICGGPCAIEALLREGKLNTEKCKFYKTLIPWTLAQ